MSYIVVYVTFGDVESARDVSKDLVEKRLVSCANILPKIQSIYRWNDEIHDVREVAVIFKTRAENFEKVRARIVELHSYDTPCVVSMPIVAGHKPFLDWVSNETSVAE